MRIVERGLFFRYALPCAGTLVRRGNISGEELDEVVALVAAGKDAPNGWEKHFKVALTWLTFIAENNGKNVIDADVMHRYYWFMHDRVIADRYALMGDFDPQSCRIHVGKVMNVRGKKAILYSTKGKVAVSTLLSGPLKEGDYVAFHYGYVVEKISEDEYLALKTLREKPLPKPRN
ncbi:Uncharacterised protein [uncultured archaeon]|nr:Uncharacterised protein [uncultured archaeon]